MFRIRESGINGIITFSVWCGKNSSCTFLPRTIGRHMVYYTKKIIAWTIMIICWLPLFLLAIPFLIGHDLIYLTVQTGRAFACLLANLYMWAYATCAAEAPNYWPVKWDKDFFVYFLWEEIRKSWRDQNAQPEGITVVP